MKYICDLCGVEDTVTTEPEMMLMAPYPLPEGWFRFLGEVYCGVCCDKLRKLIDLVRAVI